MTIPQFRQALHSVVFPLVDSLILRLRSLVEEFQRAYAEDAPAEPLSPSTSTDAEYTVLVNALERLLLIAVAETMAAAVDEEPKAADRAAHDSSSASGGLLGYMSGVLGSTEAEVAELSEETKVSCALRCPFLRR